MNRKRRNRPKEREPDILPDCLEYLKDDGNRQCKENMVRQDKRCDLERGIGCGERELFIQQNISHEQEEREKNCRKENPYPENLCIISDRMCQAAMRLRQG